MSNSTSSISVICRIRPLIDFEASDLNNQDCIHYISDTTIGIGESTSLETFTFDRVLDPSVSQPSVYDYVGKCTIEDVLSGYNGTIFAYGQTGSGKTYTMLGDIFDESTQGIIPRAAKQIFEYIEADESETEFTLKCSLVEIYKENLRDLLDIEANHLQIKECPRRGIYIKGLTQVCVTNEKEIIDLLCLGQELRTVASTKLNSSSSRSHFLFVVEVLQKLPNDSEKKGILNLVDLAGSEKVNSSGVTGNRLEEAKKINLSLSALGNVIHALIYAHDHVPYRDSKLTRLLQESLGGNFKTTLLVTGSPAARSQNETLDSLKFAVRAKAIKNKVRINLKNPPGNYIKIIEMLKAELLIAKNEIKALKSDKSSLPIENKSFHSKSSRISVSKSVDLNSKEKSAKPPQGPSRNPCVLSTNSIEKSKLSISSMTDSSYLPTQEKAIDDISSACHICKDHEIEIERLHETISVLRSDKEFIEGKVQELEIKLISAKTKQLVLEQKAHEYYQLYSASVSLIHKDTTENSLLRLKCEKLQKQINKLVDAIEMLERKHKSELEVFKNFRENTVFEFKEDSGCVNNRSDIPVLTLQPDETKTVNFDSFFIACDPKAVNSVYSEMMKKEVEDPSFYNKDYTIYILRQQILQAAIINSELTSNISNLNWKISLLKHKYTMKRELCSCQQEHIKKLEEIVDHLHESYSRIVNITEKVDLKSSFSPQRPRFRTLKSVTHKQAFTSRGLSKRITETAKNITAKMQVKIDDTSLTLQIKELESNLNLQKLFNMQLKRNNDIYKEQSLNYLQVLNEVELKSFRNEKEEREKWKKIFEESNKVVESELVRKQEEIIRLNDILGAWINSFMMLQEANNLEIIAVGMQVEMIELVRKTASVLEALNNNSVKYSFQMPFVSAKSCTPFLMSFKGDCPLE